MELTEIKPKEIKNGSYLLAIKKEPYDISYKVLQDLEALIYLKILKEKRISYKIYKLPQ